MTRIKNAFITAAIHIAALASATGQAATIGGLTFERAGGSSPGHYFSSVVAATYIAAHPDYVLVENDTLTTEFLDEVDVLILGSVRDNMVSISPLSASEVDALTSYIENGGGVIILADNEQVAAGNQTLLSPFGMAVDGIVSGGQIPVVPVNEAHPITNGINEFLFTYPGYITNLGQTTCRAEMPLAPSSTPCGLAVADHGALSPGSGALIVLADYNLHQFVEDQQLFKNMLEFAEPRAALLYIDSVSLPVGGISAVAALAFEPLGGTIIVTVKAVTGELIQVIPFFGPNSGWVPDSITAIPDENGNLEFEIGVLATNEVENKTVMQIKDVVTKSQVGVLQFPR